MNRKLRERYTSLRKLPTLCLMSSDPKVAPSGPALATYSNAPLPTAIGSSHRGSMRKHSKDERSRDAGRRSSAKCTEGESAEDVNAKRLRLTDLKRGSYASTNAIANLMKVVRSNGIPEHTSARTQGRARKSLCSTSTTYGPIVQSMRVPVASPKPPDPPYVTLPYQHPLAMLDVSARDCEPFAVILKDALQQHGDPTPAHPWNLIWYFDEIGVNPLAPEDSRKTYGHYWSLLEFGPRLLCTESCWFVAAAVRTKLVKLIAGGASHVSKVLLRTFFHNDGGDFKTGMFLHIRGLDRPLILFVVLGLVCGDLDALFKFLCSKGQSANLPCPMCMNLCSIKSGWGVGSAVLRVYTCLSYTDMKPHTDASIRAMVASLGAAARDVAAGNMTEAAFDQLQTEKGWNHVPDSVLFDELIDVRPRTVLRLGWFHIYLQTGKFNYEFGLAVEFLKAIKPPIKLQAMQAFADRFVWPKRFPSPAHLLAKGHISKDTLHFKCAGSEALSLYPVLQLYFDEVLRPLGVCSAVVDSFLSLCSVLDMLQDVNEGRVTPDELRAAIQSHLTKYQRAYNEVGWVYKHHASLHLWEQLEKCGLLIALFTLERRHKIVKRYVHDRRSGKGFEQGLIEEVTLQHLYDMRTAWYQRGVLEASRAPSRKVADAIVDALGEHARVHVAAEGTLPNGRTVHLGDTVVVLQDGAHVVGELWLLMTLTDFAGDETDVACFSIWPRIPGGSRYCRNFEIDDTCPTYVPLSAVCCSVIYCVSDSKTTASCLIPRYLRSSFAS
jgi:hypothetical protein